MICDHRDVLLQEQFPTVMVPRFGNFRPLAENGRRFLSASDGLWLEVRTDWLHLVWPLARQDKVAMPYGTLEKQANFLYGEFPVELVGRFLADARAVFPSECAAWFVWDKTINDLHYRLLRTIRTGIGRLEYERPRLTGTECLICDIHSHGPIPARFSAEDDRDDKGETKISAVVGTLGVGQTPSIQARLCVAGLVIPLRMKERLSFLEE